MQRVGGKAAGFINKKFFHPSSLRNQEKLWLAQTAHDRETKAQEEKEKRRVEEMQVEELRKQMYLQGQATKGTDALYTPKPGADKAHLSKDQKLALDEQQRRKNLLKQEREARLDQAIDDEENDACELVESKARTAAEEAELLASLAKSGYKEDVHVLGHESVWGSWYVIEDKKWGYGCCRSAERLKRCPLAPEEVKEELSEAKGERGVRGKRRRRGGVVNLVDNGEPSASSSSAIAPPVDDTAGSSTIGEPNVLEAATTAREDEITSENASTVAQSADQVERGKSPSKSTGEDADNPPEGEHI